MKDDKFSRLKYWWEEVERLQSKGEDETLRRRLYLLDAEIRNTLKGAKPKKQSYFVPLSVVSILLVLASLFMLTLLHSPFRVQRSLEHASVTSESGELASEIPLESAEPQAHSLPAADRSSFVGETAMDKDKSLARPRKISVSSSARSREKPKLSASASRADESKKEAPAPTTETSAGSSAQGENAELSRPSQPQTLDPLKLLLTLEDGLMGR